MNETLDKGEKFLSESQNGSAWDLILRDSLLPGQTAEKYFRWDALCETLGLKLQAADCYELAILREPNSSLIPPKIFDLKDEGI